MPEVKPPIRPEESLAKMIASLPEKTGRSLDEWKQVIAAAGWQKHGEIIAGLKGEHGVSHGYANQIALNARDAGNAAPEDPIRGIFAKREKAKEIYDAVMVKIQSFGGDVDLAPKKGYVSIRRSKQFAILQPAADRLDVGIQLKGAEPTARLESSGSFNAMLSHRVRVSDITQVNDELVEWLRKAYEAS